MALWPDYFVLYGMGVWLLCWVTTGTVFIWRTACLPPLGLKLLLPVWGCWMKFGVGQSVARVEDKRFVTGTGCYTDDVIPALGCGWLFCARLMPMPDCKSLIIARLYLPRGQACGKSGDLDADQVGDIHCHFKLKILMAAKCQ